MDTLERIAVDFNNLGVEDQENLLPLGAENSQNLRNHALLEGQRATFFEEGSLEAEGVLQARIRPSDGKTFWYAVLDLDSMRQLDPTPLLQSAAERDVADTKDVPTSQSAS
jgi:hypothetical protein